MSDEKNVSNPGATQAQPSATHAQPDTTHAQPGATQKQPSILTLAERLAASCGAMAKNIERAEAALERSSAEAKSRYAEEIGAATDLIATIDDIGQALGNPEQPCECDEAWDETHIIQWQNRTATTAISRCGHSACSQYFIDTGDTRCLDPDLELYNAQMAQLDGVSEGRPDRYQVEVDSEGPWVMRYRVHGIDADHILFWRRDSNPASLALSLHTLLNTYMGAVDLVYFGVMGRVDSFHSTAEQLIGEGAK